MCGGSGIVIEHEGQCNDEWEDKPCAICRGEELPPEFVEWLEQAVAHAENGQVMTAEEAIELFRRL
jgi:hypothetical protein